MPAEIFVKPAPRKDGSGAPKIIRYPGEPAKVLPADGARVSRCSYWLRRLKAGDVVFVGAAPGGRPETEE